MSAKSTTRRLTLQKVLYHPLTWIAVGVHVVLLVIPFGPSQSEAVEENTEQTEDIESISVDILNLAEIATSEPPPLEPTPAPPQPASVPAPAIAPPTQLSPSTAPLPTEINPGPAAQPETVSPDSSAPTQQAVKTQTPAYDPSADQQLYIQNLDSLGLEGFKDASGRSLLLSARDFRKGTNSSYFITETAVDGIPNVQPVEKARDARRLDGEPAGILAQQRETYAAAGLSFIEVGEYGGEPLHQLTKEDGSAIMYLSLVQLQGSTLLVIWQEDPR